MDFRSSEHRGEKVYELYAQSGFSLGLVGVQYPSELELPVKAIGPVQVSPTSAFSVSFLELL